MTLHQHFANSIAGSSAIEFAMLLPVFIFVLFGLIDAADLVWTQVGMEHAVEAAARCAAVNNASCTSNAAVQTYASTQALGLNLAPSTFSFSQSSCGALVTAQYNFLFLTSDFPSSYVTLSAKSCFTS